MKTVTCVEDFRQLYRKRVPKMFYDYTESGSYEEKTFRDNTVAFENLRIHQRVGVDVSAISTDTEIMGKPVSLPTVLAPVGMLGIQYPGGEIEAAKAAKAFGAPFVLSTMSICSIEQVAEATQTPFWFQLYVTKDKEFLRDLLRRASDAGCSTLVVTMDLAVLAQRHKDIKNKLSIRPDFKGLLSYAAHPKWCLAMARTPYKSFGNVVGHAKGVDDLASLLTWAKDAMDPCFSWNDLEWVRKEWHGQIIVKGILHDEDAKIACDIGVEGCVVSNHGGRQLDGAGTTVYWMPKIADAVGDQMELMMDSGVRTGMDIFKARALGASSVLLGRAMVYALGAQGRQGVERLLELLRSELKTTLALSGKCDVASIEASDVY